MVFLLINRYRDNRRGGGVSLPLTGIEITGGVVVFLFINRYRDNRGGGGVSLPLTGTEITGGVVVFLLH